MPLSNTILPLTMPSHPFPSRERQWDTLFAARTGVALWHAFPAPRGNGNGPPHIPTHPRTPLACDIRLHTPNYRYGTPAGAA